MAARPRLTARHFILRHRALAALVAEIDAVEPQIFPGDYGECSGARACLGRWESFAHRIPLRPCSCEPGAAALPQRCAEEPDDARGGVAAGAILHHDPHQLGLGHRVQ